MGEQFWRCKILWDVIIQNKTITRGRNNFYNRYTSITRKEAGFYDDLVLAASL